MKKHRLYLFCYAAVGLLNGLFGAGGGSLLVPLLEKQGLSAKQAHATSIAIILPLSLVSLLLGMMHTKPDWNAALWLLPPGIFGAMIGARLLHKIPEKILRKIFAAVLLIAAGRLWMQTWS